MYTWMRDPTVTVTVTPRTIKSSQQWTLSVGVGVGQGSAFVPKLQQKTVPEALILYIAENGWLLPTLMS